VATETGVRITGLFGPIPCGCLTVSKMRNESEGVDFEMGCICIGLFAGYDRAKCSRFADPNCRRVRE
jgi:hypothetical protein